MQNRRKRKCVRYPLKYIFGLNKTLRIRSNLQLWKVKPLLIKQTRHASQIFHIKFETAEIHDNPAKKKYIKKYYLFSSQRKTNTINYVIVKKIQNMNK